MEIKRIASLIMASALVATSVFYDVSPVYASQDKGGIVDAGPVEASEGSPAAENAINADTLSAADTAGEIVDAAPTQETFTDAGAIIDVPGLGNSGIVDDITVSGDEYDRNESISSDAAVEKNNYKEWSDGRFTYLIDDDLDTAIIKKWHGGSADIPEEITLPDTYNSGRLNDDKKRSVVEIGDEAFSGEHASELTEIIIPEYIKIVGNRAFMGCIQLTKVTFPGSMDEIGENAFEGCTSLSIVNLPEKLKILKVSIFIGCSSLTSIKIPKDMDVKVSISQDNKVGPFSGSGIKDIIFEKGTKKIPDNLFAGCNSLEEISLPADMTTVGNKAFINCAKLRRLIMSDDMTDIGDNAFAGCALTGSLKLSPYLKNLGSNAFGGCASLTEVSIPDNIRVVGDSAFANCTSLYTVTFDEGDKRGYEGGVIGTKAFSGCTALRTIEIPNSFTKIGNQSFTGCNSLVSMTLKNKYENITFGITIGDSAFDGCSELQTVTLEEKQHLITIGKNSFANCPKLIKVSLSSYLEAIGDCAFMNCTSLPAIIIPNSVKKIGSSAFEKCDLLGDVTLSTGLEELGARVFADDSSIRMICLPKSINKVNVNSPVNGIFVGCDNLKDIRFEGGISTIADNLLRGTESVENLVINDTVTSIGNYAFDGCVKLNNLTIPSSVVSIGDYAFNNCLRLVDPNGGGSLIPTSVRTIGKYAFYGCVKLTSASLKEGLEKLGEGAFMNCSQIRMANVPDSVSSVGVSCFENCLKLTSVNLPKNMTSVPDKMFKECVELTTVNLSKEKLTSIGVEAFYNCDSLVKFNNDNFIDFSGYKALKEIKKSAFQKCDRIAAVSLSPATDKLGDFAFDNCNSLSDISLGTGLSTIPSNAFSNLTSLRKMIIPRNVTEIKTRAFENDNNLEEIHIPKTTLKIEPNVFSYFDKLTVYVVEGSPAHDYVKTYTINYRPEVVYVNSINYAEDIVEVDEKGKVKPVIQILPVHYSVDVTYSSSDETIFTVAEDGTVTGVIAGTATLTATAPGNEAGVKRLDTVTIRVRKPVTGVALDITSIKVGIGEKFQLTPTVSPDDATDKSVRWSSSDETVAYVDGNGKVYPKKKGTANITVTTNNQNKSAVCKVEVDSGILDAPEDWKLDLDPPTATPEGNTEVARGDKITLSTKVEGARIYYTTDGSEPVADYTGRMVAGTKLYSRPITINKTTTIRAFAICPQYKYSKSVSFTYTVKNPWGDLEDEEVKYLQTEVFKGNASSVPEGMWYAFKGDSSYYSGTAVTKLVKDYTGGEQVFNKDIYVFDGTDRLVENRDYNIAYKNNVNAQSASSSNPPTVTVKGMGSFSGAVDLKFTIAAADINTAAITTGTLMTIDAGKALKTVSPSLFFKGRKLAEGTDVVFTYYKGSVSDANKVNSSDKAVVGDYYIVISAKIGGNFKGTCTDQVRIKAVDPASTNVIMMSSVKVTVPEASWSSTGVDVKSLFAGGSAYATVKKGSTETKLVYGTDYSVDNVDKAKYPEYPAAGTYTFLLHGTEAVSGNCCIGDAAGTLVIRGIDKSKVAVACIDTKPVYMGSTFKLSDLYKADASKSYKQVTLYNKDTSEVLTEGTDYTVDMSKAAPYGKFDVVFNLKGRYEGTLTSNIVVSACDINDPKVSVNTGDAPFSKAGAIPDVTVTCGGKILKEGIDYTLAFKKNTKIPTSTAANKQPTVTIKGKGCFKGSRTDYFKIVKAPVSVLKLFVADQKYKEGKKASYYIKKPRVQDSGKTVGSKDIQKLVKSDFTYYNAMTGEKLTGQEILPVGTMIEVRARVTAGVSGSYEGTYELRDTYRIIDPAKFINRAKVKINPASYAGGEEIIPVKNSDITVTLGDIKLSSSDYEIVYITNNRNPGTAKVTLAGMGEYGGTKKATFRIK